ncbi:hypothetical protein OSB04_007868 [Centaurea solstitialis]|uniref:Amino acid transporter transmembrane domain-containing protein n=1 Tax=Centaurea solstitialis TaxID=347529 RepID=A0AA38TKP5_9ASTR|nr:hypothetical protein OSB04_007868 [Centaurea solstitialis]
MEAMKQEVRIPLLVGNGDLGRKKDEDQYTKIGTTSFFSTCFNCLNSLSGVGILSVPYALASGGWLSLMLLFAIASSTFYTGLLIQRCMDSDPTIRSYPDIGDRAFGKTGRTIVSIFMNLELYLVATEKGKLVNWNGIPSAISLFAFCYCAHPVFPTLYASMRNQHQFSKGSVVASFYWVGDGGTPPLTPPLVGLGSVVAEVVTITAAELPPGG